MDGSTAIDSTPSIDSSRSVMDAGWQWTVDGGWRNGNLMAIDGSMARTAMDNATATQRQWTVDGGWQWMARWQLDGDGLDV